MKQVIMISLVFAGLLFSGRSLGQRGNQNSNYNPGTVEVLKGEILKIDTVNSGRTIFGNTYSPKERKRKYPGTFRTRMVLFGAKLSPEKLTTRWK